jgi:hypothetical protein
MWGRREMWGRHVHAALDASAPGLIPTLVGQGRAATTSDLRRDASWLGPNCYPNVIHGSFQGHSGL